MQLPSPRSAHPQRARRVASGLTVILGAVLLAACGAGSAPATSTPSTSAPPPAATPTPGPPAGTFTATVTHITDGDTLWVEVVEPGAWDLTPGDERKVRLLRIDTPELGRDGAPAECYAEAARAALERLVPEGATVLGAYDVERADQYGRDLAHVWTADGIWVNGRMLADGFANVVTFPPNVAFTDDVLALEAAARAAGRGLWGGCR